MYLERREKSGERQFHLGITNQGRKRRTSFLDHSLVVVQ